MINPFQKVMIFKKEQQNVQIASRSMLVYLKPIIQTTGINSKNYQLSLNIYHPERTIYSLLFSWFIPIINCKETVRKIV